MTGLEPYQDESTEMCSNHYMQVTVWDICMKLTDTTWMPSNELKLIADWCFCNGDKNTIDLNSECVPKTELKASGRTGFQLCACEVVSQL